MTNRRTLRTAAATAALASAGLLSLATPASAQQAMSYQATLDGLNDSGDSGMAMVAVQGNQATVTVNVSNASPGAPHAQHIHIGGTYVCPPASADTDGDGLVSTPEGQPFYGMIEVSLTTEGDVSPESALAVDRMPTASESGQITYERTFDLPEGVTAADLANGVIVTHGIAESGLGDDATTYDGPDSPLMEGVPQEATLPSTCGTLTAAPSGGVQTGGGGTASTGTSTTTAAAAAGGAVVLLGGATVARRRRATV